MIQFPLLVGNKERKIEKNCLPDTLKLGSKVIGHIGQIFFCYYSKEKHGMLYVVTCGALPKYVLAMATEVKIHMKGGQMYVFLCKNKNYFFQTWSGGISQGGKFCLVDPQK